MCYLGMYGVVYMQTHTISYNKTINTIALHSIVKNISGHRYILQYAYFSVVALPSLISFIWRSSTWPYENHIKIKINI